MKEVCIINLTRMGDLLQTTPLMAGLKEKHPGTRITLLANSGFSEICKGIPFIDNLIVFDMQDFRKRLLERRHSLVDNFRHLESLTRQISQKEYDLVINVTHSPISALLTFFVKTKDKRGFTIDPEGHRVIRHPWMRYFFNVIPNRTYNPFHLVDMYLKIGDVIPKRKELFFSVSKEEEEKAALLLKNKGISEGDILVGIHLGASKSDKTWPVSSYAALADLIVADFGAKILLFGSACETDLAEAFETAAHARPLNFVGKTSLRELACMLKQCALFISNDTGPLHIATSTGTRVIDISTANVHFMETGPYGEGHYVVQADVPCAPCGFDVECRDRICKSIIKPHAVFEVAKAVLEGRPGVNVSDSAVWENLQVYKSHFKEDNCLGFYPLIQRPLSKELFYRIIYRYVWNRGSEPFNGKTTSIYENVRTELFTYYDMRDVHEITASIRKEIDTLSKLVSLSEEAMNHVCHIAEEAKKDELDIMKIKEIWRNAENIEYEIERIGHTTPCLKPLVTMFLYTREAMEGSELPTLAEASRKMYADLTVNAHNTLKLMKRLLPFLEASSKEEPCEHTTI